MTRSQNTPLLSFDAMLQGAKDGCVELTQNWQQGRAGFGGLMAALAAENMHHKISDGRLLRSFMGSFVAPAPADTLTIESDILREGRNVSQLSSAIKDTSGQVCFQSMASFGVPRNAEASIDHQLPLNAEDRLSVGPMPKRPLEPADGLPPVFLNNFNIHWSGGGIPMSGQNSRRVGMWVQHNDAQISCSPASAVLGLGDIAPAAVLSHYQRPVRLSSLTWSVEFVTPIDTVNPSDWFYLDYSADAAFGGYSQQSGTIHNEKGDLIALSRQCMCYFD